jgi:hypothetical protein
VIKEKGTRTKKQRKKNLILYFLDFK